MSHAKNQNQKSHHCTTTTPQQKWCVTAHNKVPLPFDGWYGCWSFYCMWFISITYRFIFILCQQPTKQWLVGIFFIMVYTNFFVAQIVSHHVWNWNRNSNLMVVITSKEKENWLFSFILENLKMRFADFFRENEHTLRFVIYALFVVRLWKTKMK